MRDELVPVAQRHGDEVLAGVITALVLVQTVLLDESAWIRVGFAAGAVGLGVVAARRARVPLLFLGLIVAVSAATLPTEPEEVDAVGLFVLLAVYTAAAHTSGRRTLVAGGMTCFLYITGMASNAEGISVEF